MAYKKLDITPIRSSEITPESVYLNRRDFIKSGVAASALLALPAQAIVEGTPLQSERNTSFQRPDDLKAITDIDDATSYNNFYELGSGKDDPKRNKDLLITEPWTIEITGEVNKPQTIDMDALLKKVTLEERVYRLRCVETWSMVVPWIGFQLSEILKLADPTSKAKYVRFDSIYDPEQLPVQKSRTLHWPYTEGLRLDEAANPLAFIAVGMYGKSLPNQNGAPLRLLVPWKYGFKSSKSIVRIEFVEEQPVSSWTQAAAHEYGFFSNVNPSVSHPRWSQAKERPLGGFLKKKTEIFNGYGEFVADMYKDMDLKRFF